MYVDAILYMHVNVITVRWSPLARWLSAGCYLQGVSDCDRQVEEQCASQLGSHNSAVDKRLSGVTGGSNRSKDNCCPSVFDNTKFDSNAYGMCTSV